MKLKPLRKRRGFEKGKIMFRIVLIITVVSGIILIVFLRSMWLMGKADERYHEAKAEEEDTCRS